MDKLDFIKVIKFCSLKSIVKRMKRHDVDIQKIISSHVYGKGSYL